jgi:hypothetical protein
MTAPPRPRTVGTKTASGTKTAADNTVEREHLPPQTGKRVGTGTATRRRSPAAERAYARREQRQGDTVHEEVDRPQRGGPVRQPRRQPATKPLPEKAAGSRVPLVVTVMTLMACGLAATLWLSIAAVSGSYRLQQAQSDVNALTAERDQLLRQNSDLDSTPDLQQRAAAQGLVPAPQAAYLVPQPDGSVAVLGQPQAADPAAPGR